MIVADTLTHYQSHALRTSIIIIITRFVWVRKSPHKWADHPFAWSHTDSADLVAP